MFFSVMAAPDIRSPLSFIESRKGLYSIWCLRRLLPFESWLEESCLPEVTFLYLSRVRSRDFSSFYLLNLFNLS